MRYEHATTQAMHSNHDTSLWYPFQPYGPWRTHFCEVVQYRVVYRQHGTSQIREERSDNGAREDSAIFVLLAVHHRGFR